MVHRSLALLAAITMTGCSLFLTSRPRAASDCSTSRAAPIVDTVVASAASLVLLSGLASAATGCPHDEDGMCAGVTILFIGAGTLFSAAFWPSAAVGYTRAGQCEELRDQATLARD
jgi:hypothetical protein